MAVRDDLDFQYDADQDAYVLPADDPAAQRYDANMIVPTLGGWLDGGRQPDPQRGPVHGTPA